MQTRKEDDACPVTFGMWEEAIACTEGINKGFGDCINDKDGNQWCLVMACASGGTFPLSFCAGWLLCCSLPPATAAVFTPVTGLVDCGVFSVKGVGNCINHCISGPEKEAMVDTDRENSQTRKYGAL